MSSSPAETIKEKLDIVEFLRGYFTLAPAGRNFKALCPFHKEKTPSFMVSPERQSWHCFGCGAGGDLFAFLMRYEHLEFGEALRVLAEKAGVELKRLNPAEYRYLGLLYDLNEAAKVFFVKRLEETPLAQKYLAERGLKPETIQEFEVGFASNEPDALTVSFLNAGYNPEDLLRAGLTIKTERGMQLDRFRGRIMFPIHNHFGKVVGFTGRILPQFDRGDLGKYVNSPETPVFVKSKLLYGFWKTKEAIREAGNAFLVEGQMDFLMSWQIGIKNVVASSGTALTPDHLKALRRLTDELVVGLDSDSAGWEAGERAIDLAEASDFGVRVLTLKDYKDPAEAAQRNPQYLLQALREARKAPEFYFDKYLPHGLPDRHSRDYLKRLRATLGKLKQITSAVERSFWFKELARRTGVEEKILLEEAEKVASKAASTLKGQPAEEGNLSPPLSRLELLSQRLLSAAVARDDFSFVENLVPYLAAQYRPVLDLLKGGERKADDPSTDQLINLIVLRSEDLEDSELEELKVQLTKEHLKDRRRELTLKVRQAEEAGDADTLEAALREFKELQVS